MGNPERGQGQVQASCFPWYASYGKEEAAINVAAQVQQFSAFQECVQELEKKIAVLESMLPERASQIPKPAPKRAHEERHPISGMKSSNTFGLIHTPVNDYQKIPEARAAVEKEFVKLEKIPAWDVNQVREREDVKKEKQRGKALQFTLLILWPCASSRMQSLRKLCRSTRAG